MACCPRVELRPETIFKKNVFLIIVWFTLNAPAIAQATRTWTGAGEGNLASTPENWAGNIMPGTGDNIVIEKGAGSAYTLGAGEEITAMYRYDDGSSYLTGEVIATGNGSAQTFSGTLANDDIFPNRLFISFNNGEFLLRDDGDGLLVDVGAGSWGSGMAGTIDYLTGAWTIDASHANLSTHVIWDIDDISPGDWTQAADYSGTVTFLTKYPGQGTFTNLFISGNVNLQGGKWAHPKNTGGDTAVDRLAITVGGNFTLGADASIFLDGHGYESQRGPGRGRSAERWGSYGASHGGFASLNLHGSSPFGPVFPGATIYGSITQPESLGSGSQDAGGGALFLHVGGTATINGLVTADGINTMTSPPRQRYKEGRYAHGSGGSVFIKAGMLTGSGTISAGVDTGHPAYLGSGGGRIALIASGTASIDNMTIRAHPHERSSYGGARAGTIYIKSSGFEKLIIDQNNIGASTLERDTDLPWPREGQDPHPADFNAKLANAALVLTNGAFLQLTESMRMGDFSWHDGTLHLNGHTLYLKADEPAGSFPEDYGNGIIIYDEGRIVWGNADPKVELSLEEFDGTYTADPPYPGDGYYLIGTKVTILAEPDPGFNFVFWQGDVPEADRTANPLTLNMNTRRDVRAFVASPDPNARTWVGQGEEDKASMDQNEDKNASTAENWHPPVAPDAGNDIFMVSTRWSECQWDIDVPLGTWTQTEKFSGAVVINTKYPGQGTFTNLTITGDAHIQGGIWTHPSNTHDEVMIDRLSINIEGDFTLGADAAIDLDARGFGLASGPGRGTSSERWNFRAASHGGVGGSNRVGSLRSYGSILQPGSLGSGSSGQGGGAAFLAVAGNALINGTITADGINARTTWIDRHGHGSGGAIFLQASSLTGSGTIKASVDLSKGAWRASGGGRVAIVVSDYADLDDITITADPHTRVMDSESGGAGTIYLELPGTPAGRGTVYVDAREWPGIRHTDLPPLLDYTEKEAAWAVFRVSNNAILRLTEDFTVGDIWLDTPDAVLDLGGNTLYVNTFKHELGPGTVINEGEIVWITGALIRFW